MDDDIVIDKIYAVIAAWKKDTGTRCLVVLLLCACMTTVAAINGYTAMSVVVVYLFLVFVFNDKGLGQHDRMHGIAQKIDVFRVLKSEMAPCQRNDMRADIVASYRCVSPYASMQQHPAHQSVAPTNKV